MRLIALTLLITSLFTLNVNSQTNDAKPLPAADVKTVDGKKINTSTFTNDGKPIVISFWATWCKPCKKELDAIAENYEEWQKTTGVKLIAISIDDSRSSGKVATDAKSHAWDYEIYLDENQDFKRAMNVNNVPHTFIVNGKGEIVWQHNSYAEGDEEHLYEMLQKVAKGEKLPN